MRKLSFAILLTLLCVSTSKITAQINDSLKISPVQVKNVYQGLKQGQVYKIRYENCLQASIKLDSIIQEQNKRTIDFSSKLNESNQFLTDAQNKITELSVDLQKYLSSKIPWYLHPFTYFATGFLTSTLMISTR